MCGQDAELKLTSRKVNAANLPFPVIAPSMLKCDFGNLEAEIRKLETAGAKCLHLDVMDGHFVPNLTYGAMVIAGMRQRTALTLDAHLMVDRPEETLDNYLQAGCDWITIHVEATSQPHAALQRIRAAGCKAGIALNPGTPVSELAPLVGACDLVLVMSVQPGFGGQSYLPGSAAKIREVREMFGPQTLISVDGGIGVKTIAEVARAGAGIFVAGSSIFDQPDYVAAISEMSALAQAAVN